jgi:hypothetical protein
MQKRDHVIVADLSLSLPLRQRPYLGRAHRLGHHDGVVPWRPWKTGNTVRTPTPNRSALQPISPIPKHAANQDFSPDRAEASTARPIKSIGAWMIHQMKTEYFT